jgi:hypothetical protein
MLDRDSIALACRYAPPPSPPLSPSGFRVYGLEQYILVNDVKHIYFVGRKVNSFL